MTIELRLRAAGMLFYIVLLLNLLASRFFGVSVLNNISPQPDTFQTLATLAGAGALIFTSEAIGFIFNSIFVFFWNNVRGIGQKAGGYSTEWLKLGYEPKRYIIELYKNTKGSVLRKRQDEKFENQWETYNADIFLSYLWQNFAPPPVKDWVNRRHTAFFAGMSTVVAIGLSIILSVVLIKTYSLGWTLINSYICVFSTLLMFVFFANAQYARKEVWQTIDLWLAGLLNTRLRTILDAFQDERNKSKTK